MQLHPGGESAVLAPKYFFFLPPDYAKRVSDVERELKLRTDGDPEQPPPRKPGDRYIIGGAIVGIVVGGAVGGIAAWAYPVLPVVAMVLGGILVGGLLGLFAGDRLKKRALSAQRAVKEHRS